MFPFWLDNREPFQCAIFILTTKCCLFIYFWLFCFLVLFQKGFSITFNSLIFSGFLTDFQNVLVEYFTALTLVHSKSPRLEWRKRTKSSQIVWNFVQNKISWDLALCSLSWSIFLFSTCLVHLDRNNSKLFFPLFVSKYVCAYFFGFSFLWIRLEWGGKVCDCFKTNWLRALFLLKILIASNTYCNVL